MVEQELDRHAKLLLSAVLNPETVLAGMQALTAFRRAFEEGLRQGPKDPRVQATVREAERALLKAIEEAAGAMRTELESTSSAPAAPATTAQGTDTLVEVPIERAPPSAPTAPETPARAPRRRARAKKAR